MKNVRETDSVETLKQYCFKELRLSERDVEFLRLSVGKNPAPMELSSYYEAVVFDDLQGEHACALASLSQKLGYQGVPDALVPRLKGIIRYYSASNAMQMKELFCLLQKLNEADADVMLLGSAAMKAYYMPHTVRYMRDICFRIKSGRPGNAVRALEETGEYAVGTGEHQAAVIRNRQKPGIRFICPNGCDPGTNQDEGVFWEGAAETSFQGERVFIPPCEMLLLLVLSDVFQAALSGSSNHSGRIQWALDSAFLPGKDGFRWEKLLEWCSRLDLSLEIRIMLQILNGLFPALVPEEVLSDLPLSQADQKRIPLLLRFVREKEKHVLYVQAHAGKKKSLRYCFHLLKLYWCRNRALGKRSCLAADVLSFPSFLNSCLGIETAHDFIRLLSSKLREPI